MEKIKNIRIQKGFSQKNMADCLGISQTGYAKIEKGDMDNISLSVAIGIAKTLNIGFNDLFDIAGDNQIVESLTNQISELRESINQLNEMLDDKRQIVNFLADNDLLKDIANALYARTPEYWQRKAERLTHMHDNEWLMNDLLHNSMPFDRDDKESVLEYVVNYFKNKSNNSNDKDSAVS